MDAEKLKSEETLAKIRARLVIQSMLLEGRHKYLSSDRVDELQKCENDLVELGYSCDMLEVGKWVFHYLENRHIKLVLHKKEIAQA